MKFKKCFALFICFSLFCFIYPVNAQNLKISEKNADENDSLFFPQIDRYSDNERLAVIKTNMGNITVRLFPDFAPKAVENFIALSKSGYYDGVTFHRVIKDFMIQSGDPTGTGAGGQSVWGEDFDNEISPYLRNFRGALCMANAGPNTNGSQFYIVQNPIPYGDEYFDDSNSEDFFPADFFPQKVIDEYSKNGGCYYLDGNYTVFGQVLYGLDVVDSIAEVETDQTDKPIFDVTIDSVSVVDEKQNLDKLRPWSLDYNNSIIIVDTKNNFFKTSFSIEQKEPFLDDKNLMPYNKNGTLFVSISDLEEMFSPWRLYFSFKNSENKDKMYEFYLDNNDNIKIDVASNLQITKSVDDEKSVLPVSAEMNNGVLFVPLRSVSEALGMDVFYDDGIIGIFDKILNYSFEEFLIFKDIYK